jgi:hypothetical protein
MRESVCGKETLNKTENKDENKKIGGVWRTHMYAIKRLETSKH